MDSILTPLELRHRLDDIPSVMVSRLPPPCLLPQDEVNRAPAPDPLRILGAHGAGDGVSLDVRAKRLAVDRIRAREGTSLRVATAACLTLVRFYNFIIPSTKEVDTTPPRLFAQ